MTSRQFQGDQRAVLIPKGEKYIITLRVSYIRIIRHKTVYQSRGESNEPQGGALLLVVYEIKNDYLIFHKHLSFNIFIMFRAALVTTMNYICRKVPCIFNGFNAKEKQKSYRCIFSNWYCCSDGREKKTSCEKCSTDGLCRQKFFYKKKLI